MFIDWLNKRGSWRMIMRNSLPYLKRYYIFKSKWFTVLLHEFWASDSSYLHDHPWFNITFLIKGLYIEHELDGKINVRGLGYTRFRTPEQLHRIEVIDGAPRVWSLFIHFKRVREWGFLMPHGWVPASEYSKERVDIQGRDFELKGRFFPKVIWGNSKETGGI